MPRMQHLQPLPITQTLELLRNGGMDSRNDLLIHENGAFRIVHDVSPQLASGPQEVSSSARRADGIDDEEQ